MNKSRRDQENTRNAAPPEERTYVTGMISGATLAGVAVLILLSYMNWQEARQGQKSLDERLGKMDERLAQISTRGGAAAAPSRGPDPNRVHTVKTAGAPFKGPKEAPVSIVEFSDFQ